MRLRWTQLWRRRAQASSSAGLGQEGSEEERAKEVGARIRDRREALGLNLRELALQTRITTPVLEAMERGWRERLPEHHHWMHGIARVFDASPRAALMSSPLGKDHCCMRL